MSPLFLEPVIRDGKIGVGVVRATLRNTRNGEQITVYIEEQDWERIVSITRAEKEAEKAMHSSPETVLDEERARDLLESVEYNTREVKRQLSVMLPRVGVHLPHLLERLDTARSCLRDVQMLLGDIARGE